MRTIIQKKSNFKYLVWFAAVLLATVSGYYSLFGLSKLFAGAGIAIYIMAIALESSKVILATYLHRYWSIVKTTMRIYLVFGLISLMTITSLGVYGYLTAAFQETSIGLRSNQKRIELYNTKISISKDNISKLDTLIKNKSARLSTFDNLTVNQEMAALSKGVRRTSASKIAKETSRQVDSLNVKTTMLSDSIVSYQTAIDSLKTKIDGSELGPLAYISKTIGYDLDFTINLFILLIVCVFDPLAISLVFAADALSKHDTEIQDEQEEETYNIEEAINEEIIDDIKTEELPIYNEIEEIIPEEIIPVNEQAIQVPVMEKVEHEDVILEPMEQPEEKDEHLYTDEYSDKYKSLMSKKYTNNG